MRRRRVLVEVVLALAVLVLAAGASKAAQPSHPYVKSITCDLVTGKYTNCQVTLWHRSWHMYVTYPTSDKRTVWCWDRELTDCALRVWKPRLEKYHYYWDLHVDVTRLHPWET